MRWTLSVIGLLMWAWGAVAVAGERPNIVYVLCDDLGYGDVGALNRERGKVATPCMDRLCEEGMVFREAHSGSSVCTPTRYGILTGRYSWRTQLQSGVLHGDSLPLIAPGRETVASMLKGQGYATACFGKWHLGLKFSGEGYQGRIVDGPLDHGFDRFFGISASLDMPPFAFIEGDRFTEEPTAVKQWVRAGPAAPGFEAVDVLPRLTKEATAYIRSCAGERGTPFFMYLALASPHTPLVPTAEWKGKSTIGTYGDFVMQTDAAVGEVMRALAESGLAGETLVIFTSDNGFAPFVGVAEVEGKGHFPSGDRRGYKADIWDGGHHIPLMVRWPGRVKAGAVNDGLVCLTDLMATCADVVGAKLRADMGEDSVSMVPMMLGTGGGREAVVHHSANGYFAVREGRWKLEFCAGSAGWSAPREPAALAKGLPALQLYDMRDDVGETRNVAKENPEVVKRLTALLEKYVADGRSTPGEREKNDVRVEIRKKAKAATRGSGGGEG